MNKPHATARFRGPRRALLLACPVLGCLLVVSACSPGPQADAQPPSPDLRNYYEQQLDWHACAGDFQCGKLTVPLDYERPRGKRITLAVTRLPAGHPDERVGSLVMNPGGPGASGVQFALQSPSLLPSKVRARFDVVGFDPRGAGGSAPVQCLSDSALDRFMALDASPDTRRERRELVQASRHFAQGCAQHSRRMLAHVGTADAVRDMDVLRAALGDERLSYLGFSYGTRLGATYAELFPKKVRALVLDGAVDPTLTAGQLAVAQAKGFERALRAFVADCVQRTRCPLGSGSVQEGMDRLERFFAAVDDEPVPATGQGGRELTEGLAKYGLASGLYNKGYWAFLRRGLREAFSGDGTGLLQLADALMGRNSDGTYTNLTAANMAISCVDGQLPESVAGSSRVARRAQEAAPHFGGFIGWSGLPCAFWPVPSGEDVTIDGSGAAPILVVGTTRDPATPYAWSRELADQLDSGVLLTRDGAGHTAYGQGNTCIDRTVNRYLIEKAVPDAGKVCG